MKYKLYFLILFFILGNLPAYSVEKVTVAVLDLSPKGIPAIVANAVSDIIRNRFTNIANFTLLERSHMKAILQEHELQMSGCTDSDCAVGFGKLLSARRIVVGEVTKFGEQVMITARYVDVSTGSSLFSSTAKSKSIDNISEAAEEAADSLANKIVSGDKEVIIPITPASYYLRCIVPGWGQLYVNRDLKGYTFLGGFAASGALSVYSIINYQDKKQDYDNLPRNSPDSLFDEKYNSAKKAGYFAIFSISLTVGIYIGHWIDALFFSRPEFDNLSQADNRSYADFEIAFSNERSNPEKDDIILDFCLKYRY